MSVVVDGTVMTSASRHAAHITICAVGVFFSSFAFSFNVIGESVKSVFRLTQTEVELVSSMYFVGTGLNLVPGYYYDRLGPRRTALRGVCLTVISWTLVTLVSLVPSLFQGRYIALSLLFLAAGHGKSFILFPTMVSGLNTYSESHRGKALAFLATLYTIGPLGSVAFFNFYFSGSQYLVEKQANLTRFLMFLGALLTSNGILFCCSPLHCSLEKISPSSLHVNPKMANMYQGGGNPKRIYTYMELLWRRDILLFAISFALVLGVGVAFETNVPFFAESLDMASYSTLLIVLHRFCQGFSRLLMGYFVDCIKSTFVRVLICGTFATLSVFGLFFWTINLTSVLHIIIASLATGLARGVYGLINVLTCENYDLVNHGKIYGLADTILAIAILCMQEAFGVFYESAIGDESGTVCHGGKCLAMTGTFLGIACGIGTFSTILVAVKPV
ncbi:uncharacterized protein LOC135466917 [Liolophura sinensis]|uniref:uncharacterized protein LOC135466917 n=1 Tax=Liolophura sinensis TaxID=3198878 RepID=UPI0031593E77